MKEGLPKGVSDAVIRKEISAITTPANDFKAAIAQRGVTRATSEDDSLLAEAFDKFEDVLSAYPEGYEFEKDSIYYDCKANPAMHFKAFYKLDLLFEDLKLKAFECFPLRRSFSPCYIHIDTEIVCKNILNCKCRKLKAWKTEHWERVVELNRKVFK
ncbi:hypothetical protein BDF22DRAFT_620765, partial [Syncephalis plumigaleata]